MFLRIMKQAVPVVVGNARHTKELGARLRYGGICEGEAALY